MTKIEIQYVCLSIDGQRYLWLGVDHPTPDIQLIDLTRSTPVNVLTNDRRVRIATLLKSTADQLLIESDPPGIN